MRVCVGRMCICLFQRGFLLWAGGNQSQPTQPQPNLLIERVSEFWQQRGGGQRKKGGIVWEKRVRLHTGLEGFIATIRAYPSGLVKGTDPCFCFLRLAISRRMVLLVILS